MSADFPAIVFYLVTGMVILELFSGGLKKSNLAHLFLILRTWTCFGGVIFIIFSLRRPPLFGSFEAMVYIVFIMGVLALAFYKNHGRPEYFLRINSLVVLLILLAQAGKPMALNEDYYMYSNIWVILFFNLRLTAAAFFAHGAAVYICITWKSYYLRSFFSYEVRTTTFCDTATCCHCCLRSPRSCICKSATSTNFKFHTLNNII